MVAAGRNRAERWNLAGATALVTGGSKGIGYIHTYIQYVLHLYHEWSGMAQ